MPHARRLWIPGSGFQPSPAMTLFHLLHEYPNRAAARQADLPGGLVGDAKFQHFRFAAFDHVERLGDDRAFDAAARHRAEEIAFAVDDQIRADRTRRRTPGLNDRGERHFAAVLAPVLGGFEDVGISCEHEKPLVTNREQRAVNSEWT